MTDLLGIPIPEDMPISQRLLDSLAESAVVNGGITLDDFTTAVVVAVLELEQQIRGYDTQSVERPTEP